MASRLRLNEHTGEQEVLNTFTGEWVPVAQSTRSALARMRRAAATHYRDRGLNQMAAAAAESADRVTHGC